MSWTDERVQRLSTLWLEGRSASQIATELGEGVSRNAVIGKVHRLGLSGRATPPAVAEAAPAPIVSAPPREAIPEARTTPEIEILFEPEPEATPVPIAFDLAPLRSVKDMVIPLSDRVTMLELGASMCRWPIGDPTNAEFRFCGCRAVGTYCPEHARVAFQPVADRRRADRMVRIA